MSTTADDAFKIVNRYQNWLIITKTGNTTVGKQFADDDHCEGKNIFKCSSYLKIYFSFV